MKNEIIVRSLPAIELLLFLPASYPSNQRPLIYSLSKFYDAEETIKDFMIEELNQKWSEEMPCLYDMSMYIQDELLENYFEAKGYPQHIENDIPTMIFRFGDA